MELPVKPGSGERLGRVILIFSLALVALAIVTHLRSGFSRALAQGRPVSLELLTNPPAVLLYDPRFGKVSVRPVQESGAASASTASRVAAALEAAGQPSEGGKMLYFIPPGDRDRQAAWDTLKRWLNGWRCDPRLALGFFTGYAGARLSGNCNIPVTDFLALVMEATRLEVADFMISSSAKPDTDTRPAQQNKILVVEVLNASGQKGAGALVTKFLRDINGRGAQKLDVIRFDNYSVTEAKSRFIYHTGRIDDVGLLAQGMGLVSAEIVAEKSKMPLADVTVIVGVDYLRVLDSWKAQEMIH